MGESPEDFTKYWLSRFPLLLVHTWTVMQCVTDETTFSQYYHHKFRYSQINYDEYEVEEIPNCEENILLNTEEKVDFMSKKSPRKQQKVSFYVQKRRYGGRKGLSVEEEEIDKKPGVGLFRNLNTREKDVVDVSDVKLVCTKDPVKSRISNRRSSNVRHRIKKQVEEPLIWKVSEK